MVDLNDLATEQFCYLTTTGRVTGHPHKIEIWFGMKAGTAKTTRTGSRTGGQAEGQGVVYMLSGGRDKSDWVRNLTKQPAVTIRIGRWQFDGLARKVPPATEEDRAARRLLLDKYGQPGGDDLSEWGRNSLPIAIELKTASARGAAQSR